MIGKLRFNVNFRNSATYNRIALTYSRIRSFSTTTVRIGQPHPLSHPHLLKTDEITPGIHKSEFIQRRRDFWNTLNLVAEVKGTPHDKMVALVPSSPEVYMSHDIPYDDNENLPLFAYTNLRYTFRQNTNFLYLTGFQEPQSLLLLQENKSTLFVRERDPTRELWTGPRTGTALTPAMFGIDEAHTFHSIRNKLKPLLQEAPLVFFNTTVNQEITDLVLEAAKDIKLDFVDTTAAFSVVRLRKSPMEIELMRRSCQIAAEAMVETMKYVQPDMPELNLAAKMEFECRIRGSERQSYPCVIAGGNNANTLHCIIENNGVDAHFRDITNDMVLRSGDLVLMDAGCEFHGYSSDITRTFPINGKFTQAQREIYDIVLQANRACIDMCHPDGKISLNELQLMANEVVHRGLKRLGLVGKDATFSTRQLFPHSIGHWLGMDVHDVNDMSTSTPLEPGMIITIEPGVYIPDDPAVPEQYALHYVNFPRYRGIGVRIEDDVLITEQGPEVMTRFVPKDSHEIEAIMKK